MIKGINLGHGDISTFDDLQVATANGANASRHISRWDGDYGSQGKSDMRLDGADHDIDPIKADQMATQVGWARSLGHTIFLGNDSNNLQGSRGEGYYDLWNQPTREARQRAAEFIRLGCYHARRLQPDYIEPIVEPRGSYVTIERLQDYQEQFMTAVLERTDYAGKFLIGPITYGPGNLRTAIDPRWLSAESPVKDRLALTCNVYESLCLGNRWDIALGNMLRARDAAKLDLIINQIWTDASEDPNGEYLAGTIRKLQSHGVGSIIWTACAAYPGGSGMAYLERANDLRSAHVLQEARWAAVRDAWAAVE